MSTSRRPAADGEMSNNTTPASLIVAPVKNSEEVNHGLIIWISCGALVCTGVITIIIILYLKHKNRNTSRDKNTHTKLLTPLPDDREKEVNNALLDKHISVSVPEIPPNTFVAKLGPSTHAYECVDLVSSNKSVNYSGYISRIDEEEEILKAKHYGKYEDDKTMYEIPKNISKSDSVICKRLCVLGDSKFTLLNSSNLSSFSSGKISSSSGGRSPLINKKNNTDSSSMDYQIPQSDSPKPPIDFNRMNNCGGENDTVYDIPSNKTTYSNLPTTDTYKNMVAVNHQDLKHKVDIHKRYDVPLKVATHNTPRSSFSVEQPKMPLSHNYCNTDVDTRIQDNMQKIVIMNYSKDNASDEETIYDVPRRVNQSNSINHERPYSSSLPNILTEDVRENNGGDINTKQDVVYNIPSFNPPRQASRSINLILSSRDDANLRLDIESLDLISPRESFAAISPTNITSRNNDDNIKDDNTDTVEDKTYATPSNVRESSHLPPQFPPPPPPTFATDHNNNGNLDNKMYDVPMKVLPIENQKPIIPQFPTTDKKNTIIYENGNKGANQVYDVPSNKNNPTNGWDKNYDIPSNVHESPELPSQFPTKYIATNNQNPNTTKNNEINTNDPSTLYDIPSTKNQLTTTDENHCINNVYENTMYDIPSNIPASNTIQTSNIPIYNNTQKSPALLRAINKNSKTIVATDNTKSNHGIFNGVIV